MAPHLWKRVDKRIDNREFSGVSDIIATAITEFLMKLESCDHPSQEVMEMLKSFKHAVIVSPGGKAEIAEDVRKRLNIPEPAD